MPSLPPHPPALMAKKAKKQSGTGATVKAVQFAQKLSNKRTRRHGPLQAESQALRAGAPPPPSPCLCLPVARHVVASLDMGAGAGLADEACVLPAAQWDELEQLGEAVRRGPTPLIALPLAHCVCGITADRRRDGAGRDDAARRGG